jgi:hypothetical protein
VLRHGFSLFLIVSVGTPIVVSGQAQPERSPATSDPVMERFLARTDTQLTQYRAIRRIEARNERFKAHGWADVLTELTPDGFRYTVLREGGSEYIRSKVLRPMLEQEERSVAAAAGGRASVTPSNYDIEGIEASEPGVVKMTVKPKRREITLIDGAVFVTEDDADLVRVEGRLSKNPSFWTRRVDVVRVYDRVAGVRVPVRMNSTAQLRFAGTSTLSVVYEYQMINGVAVAPANAVASRP